MKKIVKGSFAFLAVMSLGAMKANAKIMTPADIEKISSVTVGGETMSRPTYIMGKNVYLGTFTMADALASAFTVDTVDEILYYKDGANVWKNASHESGDDVPLDTDEIAAKEFNMTMLVGEKDDSDTHLYMGADNASLYDADDYIKTEGYANGRTAEYFEDANAAVRITGAISVSAVPEVGAEHTYNTENLDVSYANGVVTLIEEKPLLSYTNSTGRNASWFAFILKTNKEVSADVLDGTVKIYNYGGSTVGYGFNREDYEDVERHGGAGDGKEVILWLEAEAISMDSENPTVLELTKTDGTKQTITFAYEKEYVDSFIYTTSTEVTIDELAENVEVVTVQTGESEYKNIFYTKVADITKFDVTIDGVKYQAQDNGDGTVIMVPYMKLNEEEVRPGAAVDLGGANAAHSADHKFNQEGLSINVAPEENTNNYTVTVTSSRLLKAYDNGEGNFKWFSVIMDLGIDPSKLSSSQYGIAPVDYQDAERHGATTETAFVMWVDNRMWGKTITFKNSENEEDVINITFDVNEEFEPMAVSIEEAEAADLYPTSGVTEAEAQENVVKNIRFNDNMSYISSFVKEQNEDTKEWNVTLTATDILKEIADNDTNKVAFIVDFGIDIEDEYLTVTPTGVSLDSTVAKKMGATTDTAVAVWVSAGNTNKLEVTNALTGEQVVINVALNEVTTVDIEGGNAGSTVSVENISNEKVHVSKVDATKFVVGADVTEFTATTVNTADGTVTKVNYVYTVNDGVWSATLYEDFVLTSAVGVAASENSTNEDFNQNAIGTIEVDQDTNTVTIPLTKKLYEVTHDGTLGNWYSVKVDLGLSDYASVTIDGTSVDVDGNMIVLWLNEAETATETGKTITFTNTVAGKEFTYDLVVKSTYTGEELAVIANTTKEVSMDTTIYGTLATEDIRAIYGIIGGTAGTIDNTGKEEYTKQMLFNNMGISTSVTSDKVIINNNKPLLQYNNGYAERSYFAILLDLGVDPTKLEVKAGPYAIDPVDVDPTQVAKFGGSGTQFLMWLDKEMLASGNKTITFANNENPNDTIAVEFEYQENITPFENVVVNRITSNEGDANGYVFNQSKYTVAYTNETVDGNKNTTANLAISHSDANDTSDEKFSYVRHGVDASWYAVSIDLGVDKEDLFATGIDLVNDVELISGTTYKVWFKYNDLTSPVVFTNLNNGRTLTVTLSK